jgi:cyclophilin family peptidyl-prolyl cis-trans isomerase
MNKKIIILTIGLLLISGCGAKNEVTPIKDVNNDSDKKSMETTNPLTINFGGKPFELKDLFKEYSGAIIKTNMGDIKVKFYGNESPLTVNNFLNLAQDGFYNGTKFHRVIKDFMIQGGDPNSKDDDWSNDGMGGPEYKFKDEINSHKLVKGSFAMANAGPNTNGSQFFIVTAESTPWLDGKHTNFGYVTEGMDVVDKIGTTETGARDYPVKDIIVESVELVK